MNAKTGSSDRAVLYTPAILALAVDLARYPLGDNLDQRGHSRSRVCGSTVDIGLVVGADGVIQQVGARVTACAIGQAAAAIFLNGAAGQDRSSIVGSLDEIEAWLAGTGPVPNWPGFAAICPARNYSPRHGAIILPWHAAVAALSNSEAAD